MEYNFAVLESNPNFDPKSWGEVKQTCMKDLSLQMLV